MASARIWVTRHIIQQKNLHLSVFKVKARPMSESNIPERPRENQGHKPLQKHISTHPLHSLETIQRSKNTLQSFRIFSPLPSLHPQSGDCLSSLTRLWLFIFVFSLLLLRQNLFKGP